MTTNNSTASLHEHIFRGGIMLLMMFGFISAHTQSDIPINTWRAHLSYNNIISIAFGDDVIFGASEMGIVEFDKEDHSFSTLSKVNGLSSSGITCIAFNPKLKQLLVSYDDGNLDIVHNNTVTNFPRLKELNNIVGSKKINHIRVNENFAYLSTDYGIVLFDLNLLELRETWRDLGRNGTAAEINKTVIRNDSIVAATNAGLIIGNLSDNLLDYNNWSHVDAGELNAEITSVDFFNNAIYAGVDNKGIFTISSSGIFKQDFLNNSTFKSVEASSNDLLIVADEKLWMLNNGSLVQVADDEITSPLFALADQNNIFWVGDSIHGLVSNVSGTFENYLPNGPSIEKAFGLRYLDGKIFAFNGGFSDAGSPLGNAGVIDYFDQGLWKNKNTVLRDISDLDFFAGNLYTASFGDGLLQEAADGTSILFDHSNSVLSNSSATEKAVDVSALYSGSSGLWIANFNSPTPLLLLHSDNTWTPFSPNYFQARYPVKIIEDYLGRVWLVANAANGGGVIVFDPATNESILKNDLPGTGGLLSNSIESIAIDRDGNVWVGTDTGLAYFYDANEDAVIPIFENRYLLRDEVITDIEVDGANRKWVATPHGAWLFGPTGESLVYNFTEANSPLLSDNVLDIEINSSSGEVFFATDKGIISFRDGASSGSDNYSSLKIFPNPVSSSFSGTVGISGLMTDSAIKITDVSGKLVWSGQAQGGTATWNLRDINGRHAGTGVYLVFAATSDGRQGAVGKIAVIE